jgi:hypothetical protein
MCSDAACALRELEERIERSRIIRMINWIRSNNTTFCFESLQQLKAVLDTTCQIFKSRIINIAMIVSCETRRFRYINALRSAHLAVIEAIATSCANAYVLF